MKGSTEVSESGDLSSTAKGNLELLAAFYEREDAKISGIQLLIERISSFFGSPAYFAFAVAFILVWVLFNLWGARAGLRYFDEPLSSAKIASAEPAAPIMLLWHHDCTVTLLAVVVRLVEDALRWLVLLCRSTKSLEAENLFLRRQLALYFERGVKPQRLDVATRVSLVVLSKLFDRRNALSGTPAVP